MHANSSAIFHESRRSEMCDNQGSVMILDRLRFTLERSHAFKRNDLCVRRVIDREGEKEREREGFVSIPKLLVLISSYTQINWIVLHYSCDKKKHTHSQEKRISILLKYIYIYVSYTHGTVSYNQSRFPNDNLNTDTISWREFFETFELQEVHLFSCTVQVGRVQAHLFAKVLRIMMA